MILVTGGTGFLGSHLLLELLKTNQQLRAIKRKNSNLDLVCKIFSYYEKDAASLMSRIDWVEGDVLDVFSLEDAFSGVSEVYHCAALVSFNPKSRNMLYDINVRGTSNVVNAALKCKIGKLCYVSSIAAIGRTENSDLITEKTAWKSSERNSNYAISKYEAEKEVWRGIEEGLNAVIVNPSVILGPGDWNSGSAKIFLTLKNGSLFYTKGINGFVDVRDVCSAMHRLMKSEICNQRFIVSAENLSYRQLFNMILEIYKKKPAKYNAAKLLLEAAWRFERIKSILFNTSPLITKETVNTSRNQYFYSTDKLEKALNFVYLPIDKTIEFTAKLFMNEIKQKKNIN